MWITTIKQGEFVGYFVDVVIGYWGLLKETQRRKSY
jgi:hypothetical protein